MSPSSRSSLHTATCHPVKSPISHGPCWYATACRARAHSEQLSSMDDRRTNSISTTTPIIILSGPHRLVRVRSSCAATPAHPHARSSVGESVDRGTEANRAAGCITADRDLSANLAFYQMFAGGHSRTNNDDLLAEVDTLRGEPQIEVTFVIAAQCMLKVSAVDSGTGKSGSNSPSTKRVACYLKSLRTSSRRLWGLRSAESALVRRRVDQVRGKVTAFHHALNAACADQTAQRAFEPQDAGQRLGGREDKRATLAPITKTSDWIDAERSCATSGELRQ